MTNSTVTTKPATTKPATTKAVETKNQTPKFDMRAAAEKIEAAFKTNKDVDVIADSNRETPSAITYDDYRFIHFYNPGTEKDMFQLYISSKSGKFIIRTTAAEYLDKSVEQKAAEKKVKGEKKIIHVVVTCPIDLVPDVAKKIITAYQSIPAKPVKEKKAEAAEKPAAPAEKKTTKKPAEKKATVVKKPAPKKAANK